MTENRILPHDLDAERSVLGGILIDNQRFNQAAELIKARDFFRGAHQKIFQKIAGLIDRNDPADLLTVKDELDRAGELESVGGPAYISALTDGVPRSANVEYYARIVKEKSVRRALIGLASRVIADAHNAEQPSDEILRQVDRGVIALQSGATSRMVDTRESSEGLYADLDYRVAHKGQLTGVDTGFTSINQLTSGWQCGEMTVLAARPSMGKTAMILSTAIAAARTGKRVVIFSLEMRRRQLEYRMLATLSGVALTRIMGGYLVDADYDRMIPAMDAFRALPIWIDDRGGQSVQDVRWACRRQRSEHGLDLAIIDYVQLMPGSLDRRGANRNEELTDISRRIKALTDEVGIPIILLSQLNRAGDTRSDKVPILSDLRESGALEQDADNVVFLHRKDHRVSGTTLVIFRKQRNGPTGTLPVTFDRDTQIFTDGGETPVESPEPAPKPVRARPPSGWKRGARA